MREASGTNDALIRVAEEGVEQPALQRCRARLLRDARAKGRRFRRRQPGAPQNDPPASNTSLCPSPCERPPPIQPPSDDPPPIQSPPESCGGDTPPPEAQSHALR